MQTKNPKRRVNWIFVGVLIIVFPLLIFFLFMTNVIPPNIINNGKPGTDTVKVDTALYQKGNNPDSIKKSK